MTVREALKVPLHFLLTRAFIAAGMIMIGIGNLNQWRRERRKRKAAQRR